jgi:hypothetical protein
MQVVRETRELIPAPCGTAAQEYTQISGHCAHAYEVVSRSRFPASLTVQRYET